MSRPRIESGSDWLGHIPEEWELVPLGRVFRERRSTVSDADYDPLSVSMAGIVPRMENVALTSSGDNRKLVRAGDYVINSRSDRKGSGGLSPMDGSVSVISTVLRPVGIEPRFAHHLLRSTGFQEEFYRWGSGIVADLWSTRYDKMSKITLPLPPIAEQLRIADFLDRETAKIDTLVEKQSALVERLRERRIALVFRAVTKGLKRAETRESGTAWIGEVPTRWEVVNIRRVASMKTGHTPSRAEPAYWEDCSIPWFTLADVWQLRDGTQTHVRETSSLISPLGLDNSAAELLPEGTVILSRTASVGFSGILATPMATSQDFWNWVCGPRLLPRYLLRIFHAMKSEFDALRFGSTHQTIYRGNAAGFRIPLPPLDEQHEIANYLDRETAKIDSLIAKAERFVELARERRAALVTAAVTGQLDVEGAA